ncbi:MAG: metal ABC transporter permease [Actinobacteria bacterium]|nr:metal ABC transporter permease [Actinomycetota bacterium]
MRGLLVEPFQSGFMARALIEVVLLGVIGAAVGVHVLLRRLTFLTEALQHTVFPGIAIAFALETSLLLGALVAAAVTVVMLVGLARDDRVNVDAALAVMTVAFFALGVAVVSHRSGYAADLNQLLFGRILGVGVREVVETAAIGAAIVATLAVLHKELVLVAFDRVQASALGYRVDVLDIVLNAAVALAVVASVRAVGSVLVVGFVVTPAAAARLVTKSVGAAVFVGAGLAAVSGWIALSVSYDASVHRDVSLAPGATVVVGFEIVFVVVAIAVAGRNRFVRRRAALA